MNVAEVDRNSENMTKLMRLGIRPKYKAFVYMLYLLDAYKPMDLISMADKEVVNVVTNEFPVSDRMAYTNFHTMIDSCMNRLDGTDFIRENIPYLGKDEMPTIKEFVLLVSCLVYQKESEQ